MSIQEIRDSLESADPAVQLAGQRVLKNSIIGHQEGKEAYLQPAIILALLSILQTGAAENQLQASIILGSFAYGTDKVVEQLLKFPVIDTVLHTIKPTSAPELVANCLRILVTMLKIHPIPSLLAQNPSIINILNVLLSLPSTPVMVLDQCCKLIPLLSPTRVTVNYLSTLSQRLAARIVFLIRQYKQTSSSVLPLASCLSALAHVISPVQGKELLSTTSNAAMASGTVKIPVTADEFLDGVIHLTKTEDPEIRLTAVELLAKLRKYALSPAQCEKITRPILPTLVPILDLLGNDPRVSLTLAYVCRDDEKSATMAVEVGIIRKIMAVLRSADLNSWRENELIANNLLALAGIAMHKDKFRSEIVESGGLKTVISIMTLEVNDTYQPALAAIQKTKVAACHVLRALSRSVALLRTSLASSGIIEGIVDLLTNPPLNELARNFNGSESSYEKEERKQQLEDELEVKSAVMAAICNLILDFSPLQKKILERGILDLIVEGAHSEYAPLRLNSVWALCHTLYGVGPDIKQEVLNKLTYGYLLQVCNDPEIEIQEQALEFFRNLVCENPDTIEQLIHDNIEGAESLFNLIEEKLDLADKTNNTKMMVATIYIMVHIAAGRESHRDVLAQRDSILRKLVPLMRHQSADIRTACVWLVINLTWMEGTSNLPRRQACRSRAEKLIQLGFKEKLDQGIVDPVLDVRERTKNALFQMEGLVAANNGNLFPMENIERVD